MALPPVRASLTLRQSSILGRDNLHRWYFFLLQFEVLIQKTVAVVANRNVIGEKDDCRDRVRTGFLFFSRVKIDIRNCSLFLVGFGLFGWRWATRVVVLNDYR